jgi:uncharacterized protein YndB with AHSA1/START domain
MNTVNNPVGEVVAEPFVIVREFTAPRDLVWRVWTEVEHLRQWFGPKGVTVTAAKLDLRTGGTFHSCLRSPDGKEWWGKWIFREVTAPERLAWVHMFSDKDGGITRHPLSPAWPLELVTEVQFIEHGGKTIVTLKWAPLNATEEEIKTFNAAHPGMAHGWGGTFDQLTHYLKQIQTKEKI